MQKITDGKTNGFDPDRIAPEAMMLNDCAKTADRPVEIIDYFYFTTTEKIKLLTRVRKEAEICRDDDRQKVLIDYGTRLELDIEGYMATARM